MSKCLACGCDDTKQFNFSKDYCDACMKEYGKDIAKSNKKSSVSFKEIIPVELQGG